MKQQRQRNEFVQRLQVWFATQRNGLIAGTHEWGGRRVMLVAVVVVAFTLMGRAVDPPDTTQVCVPGWLVPHVFFVPEETPQEELGTMFCLIHLQTAIGGPLGALVVFFVSLFLPHTWRHVILSLVAYTLARRMAAQYVDDLFELPSTRIAQQFITAAFEGVNYLEVTVDANSPSGFRQADADTYLARIGGPGYLRVDAGNAAVLERYGRPADAFGQGSHFISHFERLRAVVDLRDQYQQVERFSARTKDGLEVQIENLEVAFRVTMKTRQRLESDQYPFLRSAVGRIAYEELVSLPANHHLRVLPWTRTVLQRLVSRVRDYIGRTYLDDLLKQDDERSRAERENLKATIVRELESKDSRDALASQGVELIWVNLGHIVLPEDAHLQRIDTWQAQWKADAAWEMVGSKELEVSELNHVRTIARLKTIANMAMGSGSNRFQSADEVLAHIAHAMDLTLKQLQAELPKGTQRSFTPTKPRLKDSAEPEDYVDETGDGSEGNDGPQDGDNDLPSSTTGGA